MTPTFNISFFDGFFGEKKFEIDDFISVEINNDVTDISEAKIKIATRPNVSMLDKVEIWQIEKLEEKKIFSGFVSEMEADKDFLSLKITDFKQILERKILTIELKNKSAKWVLDNLLSEWKKFSGETITYEIEENITAEKNFEFSP